MKLLHPFDFLISCLILTSLFLFAESAPQNFTYLEDPNATNFPNNPPRVIDLKTYDDGTIILRVGRRNDSSTTSTRRCLEQFLSFRVINLNGTVTEVNINNAGLDPVNYCIFVGDDGLTKNPISVFPLQGQFILVNYVNTTNSSDPKTYEDWGMVVDWTGRIYSQQRYGSSFVNSFTGNYNPASSFSLNINKKLGFLRMNVVNATAAVWQQYSVDDSGRLLKLSSDFITSPNFRSFTITSFSIVNEGYAIVYANSSSSAANDTDPFKARGGVYAIFLSHGQETTSIPYILYQSPVSNITFQSLFCDIAFVGVGQVCTVSVFQNVTNSTHYVKIFFLSSGSVVSFSSVSSQGLNANIAGWGWGVTSMPFGGYILSAPNAVNNTVFFYVNAYGENDTQIPLDLPQTIISNNFGLSTITKNNNTFILALPESTNSWTLLTDQFPKVVGDSDHGYSNFQVDTTNPKINDEVLPSATNISITFYNAVDLSTGNITIYQDINSTSTNLRQMISARSPLCQISNDGLTVTVTLISSTFNQPGKTYFVQMDNNFVKSRIYQEPLTGIGSRIWMLKAGNPSVNARSAAVVGVLRLTPDASTRFQKLSKSQRENYFSLLLQEISDKVPVRLGRLSSNQRYQVVNGGTPSEQIIISIGIGAPKDGSEEGVPRVISDLDAMIKNKQITSISTGNVTNDLDSNSGFEASPDLWERYRFKLIGVLLIVTLFIILFLIAQRRQRDAQNLAVLQLGLILFNFVLEIIFVSTNAKDIQQLFIPSILFLIIPLAVNTALAFYVISKENIKSKFYEWFYKNGKVASIFTVIAAADIEALMVLQSNLAGLSFFQAPFSPEAVSAIFWGACLNIFIKNIPLVVIQIIYFRCIVTYDIVPLLLLITSCLTLVVNIIGRLYNATHRFRKRRESEYIPTDDGPDNSFGGLHPLQIPPSMLNKSSSLSPETPTKNTFLKRSSGGKRNSRNHKRLSEGFGGELRNIEGLRNADELSSVELRDFDEGTLYGDTPNNNSGMIYGDSSNNHSGILYSDISNSQQHSQSTLPLPQEQLHEGEDSARNEERSDFDNPANTSFEVVQ